MNQDNIGGLRCHDADACALGQKPCPTPAACGCAPQAQHADDAAVDALAAQMKAKLAKQRAKGYGGWDTDCTQERLSELLRGHVGKGDPVDVANFCAFLLARGEGIAAAPQAVQAALPLDMQLVPAEFVRGFGDLAHNYSLTAVAPDYYHGVERDAFSAAYKRCGNDLAKLREILTAAPAHPAEGVPALKNTWSFCEKTCIASCTQSGLRFQHEYGHAFADMMNVIDATGRLPSELLATHPTQQGLDAQMLDFINDKRVALTPEYEGPWKAEVFADEDAPVATAEGKTVRDAIRAALAAQAKQGEKP